MRLTPRQRATWLAHLFKAWTRQHHRELAPLLAPHIPSGAVIIDVGAHAGQFSKLFARMAPAGHVFAFEPSAYARSIMAPALALSGLTNVTLIPMGLSDRPGELVLHTPIKPSGSLGFGTAHLGGEGGRVHDQSVRLTTLDAFVGEMALARLDFIKADIEGWELRALLGGKASLRRFRPALFLEVDDALMARAGDTPAALFDFLAGFGYAAFRSPDLSPTPTWTGAGDYLFVAAEKA
jgi:FkbM family methyltransferase